MKFKVGDKVTPRPDLSTKVFYNDYDSANEEMMKFKGKVLTVSEVLSEKLYRLKEDNGSWCWSEEMLLCVPLDDLPTDSPMTAVEVLEWLGKHYCDGVYKDVFGYDYELTKLLRPEFSSFTVQEIVDKITAYEAAKKEKPVEVEEGYYCCVYKSSVGRPVDDYVLWGVDKQTAEDDAKGKALKHTKETGEQMRVCVEFTCHIKEDES